MGSPPRTSDSSGRPIGREITARARPQLSLVRPLDHPRPGQLLRASRGFVMRLGLSQQNRALLADTTSVRPPIDYWPWPETGSDAAAISSRAKPVVVVAATPAEPPRKVDPLVDALRRKLLQAKTPSPAAAVASAPASAAVSGDAEAALAAAATTMVSVQRVVRRGLPLTPRRFGRTWAGPATSPGGVANNAAPQVATTVAPTRFGGQSATDLPDVAASGILDSGGGGAAVGRQPSSGGRPRPSMDDAEGLRRKLDRSTVPNASGPGPARVVPADDDWAMPKPRERSASAAATSSAPGSGSPLRRAVVRAGERVPEPQPAPSAAATSSAPSSGSPLGRAEVRAGERIPEPQPGPAPGRASVATLERPRLTGGLLPDAAHPITGNGRAALAGAPTTTQIVAESQVPGGSMIQREADATPGADAVVMPPRGAALAGDPLVVAPAGALAPAAAARADPVEPGLLRRAASAPLPRSAHVDRDLAPPPGAATRARATPLRTSAVGVLRRSTTPTGIAERSVVAGPILLRRSGRADAGPLLESATFMRSLRPHGAWNAPSTAMPVAPGLPASARRIAPTSSQSVATEPAAGRITPATIASAGRQRLASIGRAVVIQRRSTPTTATVPAPAAAAASLADLDTLLSQIEAMGGWDSLLDELGVVAPSPSSVAAFARAGAPDLGPASLRDELGVVVPSPSSVAAFARAGAPDLGPALLRDQFGVVAAATSAATVVAREFTVEERGSPAARARLLDDLAAAGPTSRDRAAVLRRSPMDEQPVRRAGALARHGDDRTPTGPRQLSDELGIVAPAAFVRETPESWAPLPWVPAGPGSLFSTARGAPALLQRPRLQRSATTSDPAAAASTPNPNPTPTASSELDLSERFMAELGRHRQERARPLPVQFRAIADVIVADRTPRLSTSLASRQALAAVDKVAATTGDVIHLARVPSAGTPSDGLTGIIAHELTHVANPSPAPRFFDDDRHSAEERRATEVGEIMRSTRLRPVAAPRPSRGAPMSITTDFDDATESIRRRVAASNSSGSSNDGSDTIQRKFSGSMGGHRARPSNASETTTATTNTISQAEPSTRAAPTGSISRTEFRKLLRENFDTVVELLEDRLIADLERRGGRYRRDF